MSDWPLYPVCRAHLDELSDELGVWQHATGTLPNRLFGYCTDDVARALEVDLLHARSLGWKTVEATAWRSMAFLRDAFNAPKGRFRNFRSADGEWLEEFGSEDCQGRALAALGAVATDAPDPRLAVAAAGLFEQALPAARSLKGLRPVAAALLGCDSALEGGANDAVRGAFDTLAARLTSAFSDLPVDWPWPEPVVTYENALLPRALIAVSRRLEDEAMLRIARRVLDWLAAAQTSHSGALSLVGNEHWWPRGKSPSRFDQQPIDAASLLLAAEAAFDATAEQSYRDLAEIAYGWFLGGNDVSVALATPESGGCHDGLTPRGVNLNQGAESTIMWLTALEHMRRMRDASPSRQPASQGLTSSASQVVT